MQCSSIQIYFTHMAGWSKSQTFKALILVGLLLLLIYLICSSQTNKFDFKTRIEVSETPEWNKKQELHKLNISICPVIPPNLVGPINVNSTVSLNTIDELEHGLSKILYPGGWYRPKHCIARRRVAIIVPFRNRFIHIMIFLKNIHPFLIKQQIEYGIFVVEQTDELDFNRASLMNVGFLEALKLSEWNCFIFHDVDLIPIDDRNLYGCMDQPRHMSVAVDIMNFTLPYATIFGGVSAMTTEQFERVNGFSNSFWGWGGEDDDMYNRVRNANYKIIRWDGEFARYKMTRHSKEIPNKKRFELIKSGKKKFHIDGLNSIKYDLVKSEKNMLFTWFLVSFNQTNNTIS